MSDDKRGEPADKDSAGKDSAEDSATDDFVEMESADTTEDSGGESEAEVGSAAPRTPSGKTTRRKGAAADLTKQPGKRTSDPAAAKADSAAAKADSAAAKADSAAAKADSDTAKAATASAEADAEKSKGFSFTVTGGGLVKALGALVVVGLIVAVGLLGWRVHDLQQRQDAFDQINATSADFFTKLVSTLNADTTDQSKEILGPMATGEFQKSLEADRTDTEKNVEDLKLAVTSKVLSTSVESFDTDKAKSVVLAEVKGTSAASPQGATNLMVVQLDLARIDGTWKISKVTSPGGRTGSGDPSAALPGANQPGQTPGQAPPPAPAPTPGG